MSSIIPSFEGIFITSKERIFSSVIDAHIPNIQKNHPSAIVPTIDAKYPFVVSHSRNNFYSGSMSGIFVELKQDICEFDYEEAYKYRDELMDFLCDGKAKFLKLPDGRVWMIMVVDNPNEAQEMNTEKFTTSFSWAEIGDCESVKDLYDNDFIDISLARRLR